MNKGTENSAESETIKVGQEEMKTGKIERILSREALPPEKYPGMDRLKVGILSISAGAGTGFLTGCLARYLANTRKHSPAVVELCRGSLFDSFGMDKRFAGRTWVRFYQMISDNRNIRGMKNMDEGINWVLRSPEEAKIDLSFEQKFRLAAHSIGDVILCDMSGSGEPDYELLKSMDRIIAVIDPMPSRMLEGYETLCRLKSMDLEEENILFVINKMNRGVNRRQMLDFLNLKNPVFLPLINPEHIYTAEYNCKIPYTAGEIKRMLQEPLGEIISTLIFA